MNKVLIVLTIMLNSMASAEAIVPVRTIRALEIINAEDLIKKSIDISGALVNLTEIVGQEARVVLYAGRPIRPGDLGPPSIIGRNDMVRLVYSTGPLRIHTEGRALGRGAVGDTVRVMNMGSRAIVTGEITANGLIEVK
jgi:flagella basal body P-ring formation protein FlgA